MQLNQSQQGVALALFSFMFWGMIPLYFKILDGVEPSEILAHRIIWSFFMLWLILFFTKQINKTNFFFADKSIRLKLLLSSFAIAFNWLVYIWAISNNQLLEASLGYFINPLVTILLGVIFLKEKPTGIQKIAILIVTIAVIIQVYIVGTLPMVSLLLPFSFGFYGLIRKKTPIPSLYGLYIETKLLFPCAILYFSYIVFNNTNSFNFDLSLSINWLLILAGPMTVIPLLAFTAATARLKLSTVGYFQYISPVFSISIAVLLFKEEINQEKIITFSLILFALFLVVCENYLKNKKNKEV